MDASVQPNDFVQEASATPELLLQVEYPKTEAGSKARRDDISSMESGGPMDGILPPFEIIGTTKLPGDLSSSGADTRSTLDGVPPNPADPISSELPSSTVLEKPATSQEQESQVEGPENATSLAAQHAGDPDTHEDTGETAETANKFSFDWHATVDRLARELKEKFAEAETNGTESSEISIGRFLNTQELEAVASGVNVAVGPPPLGIDQVSICALKTRKENDGQVVLLAPRAGGSDSDSVPLLRNDGRPVSAMELGQYLRPDGTIWMGEQGRAYRPGDVVEATTPRVNSPNIGLESNSVETLRVHDKIELTAATADFASGKSEAQDKVAILRESKLEARSQEIIASTSGDSTQNKKAEITSEPKKAAEEQRFVTIWLGQTLRSVALNELGDVNYWKALAEKNSLSTETDSNGIPIAVLERGSVLMLPTASEIEDFRARASLAASLKT